MSFKLKSLIQLDTNQHHNRKNVCNVKQRTLVIFKMKNVKVIYALDDLWKII